MQRLKIATFLLLGALATSLPAPAAAQSISPMPIVTNQQPDLSVSATASNSIVGGGDQVVYTITVSNPGQVAFNDRLTGAPVYWNTPATGISLMQSLPGGSTFRSLTAGGGFTCVLFSPVVTCTGGSLQAGASATVTVTTQAPHSAGTFPSTVTVDPTNTIAERNETNNSATATLVVPQPDLALAVFARDPTVNDGALATFVAHIDNPAPSAEGTGVVLRFTMPGGASLWNATDGEAGFLGGTVNQAGFTCAAASLVVTCSGGHIPSGGRGAITLSMAAPRINGTITSSFVVDPSNAIAERDEGNNSVSLNTTVHGRPDLRIEAAHSIVPLFTRVITIHNDGVGPASGVEVHIEATKWEYFDDGGPDLYLGTFADSGFSCTRTAYPVYSYINYHSGDVLTCTGGTIAPGGVATLSVMHMLTTTDDSRLTDATVDPANAIGEVRENNNQASASTRL